MTGPIFTLDQQNRLIEMQESEYDSEAFFQSVLADHPDLLGLGGGADGKLLLVDREVDVPDAAEGSGRWSLDHLFLDRAGVPVLVEVKRSSGTRSRREVVAQMLDYAASGIAYWPIDQIIDCFHESAKEADESPESLLEQFLDGGSGEDFWRQVEANLRSGRIRMVFVADRIAKELRRIVEFLNEQMRPAEMIAIEVTQYVSSDGFRTLVPRLVGATERAATAKSVASTPLPMSVPEWLDSLEDVVGADARKGAQKLLEWFTESGFEVDVTNSTDAASASVKLADGKRAWPFFLRRSTGRLELSLQYLKNTAAFAEDQARQELLIAASFASIDRQAHWLAERCAL